MGQTFFKHGAPVASLSGQTFFKHGAPVASLSGQTLEWLCHSKVAVLRRLG